MRGIVTAPAPGDVFDSVSGRTRYDVSFIAKVVADKVENAIPLERQARMFSNDGLPVAPSTLEDLYKRSADALRPLYERMVDRIMQCDILHADETFIKLMVKGAKKCKQAYMWCRLTGVGPPMIAFHFSPSRSQDVAKSLFGDYSGTIIRDSYAGYEKLDCEVACCWAHTITKHLYQAFVSHQAQNGLQNHLGTDCAVCDEDAWSCKIQYLLTNRNKSLYYKHSMDSFM